ncbi:MAG: RecQ family ATP-dependent DNA helicase [Myxococcales bacterium]|nr:RecQ family ATP-dependent DNA helicase [Myxococcales bacterium]
MATSKRTKTGAAGPTKAAKAAPTKATKPAAPRSRKRAEPEPEPAPEPVAAAPTPARSSRSKKAAEPPPPPAPAAPPRPRLAEVNPDTLLALGREVLGITDYRPGQRQAIEHILAGKDVIAVMPTGSGKSLLYQLPSLVLPGLTVVVSPLIALIKDQVDKMVAKGVAVVRIDSTLTTRQRREMDALARAPGGKLLLTTPERMADPDFRTFLRECAGTIGVSRFVVDEAHCVSQWGHDFRPAYLSLRKALEDVGRPPVLATTATAPPHVRLDIVEQLGIDTAEIVTTTFDRPNLHYEVITFPGEDDKIRTLVTLLKKLPRPGIVYCATVKKVEELHEALARHGIPVAKYHGRLTKTERDAEQERFMASKDLVMLATNAFGLGVDKKDVRNVLHYHVPGSLEAYAQEAGRGGRDGKPTRCVLLFSPDDVAIQEYFLSGTYPTRRQVKAVYDSLCAYASHTDDTPANVANVALGAGVGAQRTRTVLSLLKDEGFIVEKGDGVYELADPPLPDELLMEKARQYEGRRIADRRRLDALLLYVKVPGCRNQAILDYLGEAGAPACGRCDNCLRSRDAALAAATEASALGARVTRQLDEEGAGNDKPKRIVKHRVVRIDQPPADAIAAPAPAPLPPPAPAPAVRRRAAEVAPAPVVRAAPAAPLPAPAPAVRRRAAEPALPAAAAPAARSAAAPAAPSAEAAPAPAVRRAKAATPEQPAKPDKPGEDDELEDDDDLDDDELDDDEDDDDLDDDEDGDDDEDDDEDDDDDDDDDLDDEDDDDLDDDEDDDDEDDDEDDDDYEVIDKTAAELAEEGHESGGEITVLARKRVPKPARVRAPRPEGASPPGDADRSAAAEARRRRRRRRRKRRSMLPRRSDYTTPVLTTATPPTDGPQVTVLRRGAAPLPGGPVIEYVRGPMRINMAPVASAAPSDTAGVDRGRGRRQNRFDGRGRPLSAAERRAERRAERLEKRKRRRRRRKGNAQLGPNAEVSFFSPIGGPRELPPPPAEAGPRPPPPIELGPDGQPLPRKRRRRRRRGRGGRGRPDFRPTDGGAPPAEAGAGAPPALPPGDSGDES